MPGVVSLTGRLRRRVRRRRRDRRPEVRAAVEWALGCAAALPGHTHAADLVGLVPAPPVGLPASAGAQVWSALEQSSATCLQRCLVLQAWYAAHDRPLEVAIGFRTADRFEAHAWLPGVHPESESEGFVEIARVPVARPKP